MFAERGNLAMGHARGSGEKGFLAVEQESTQSEYEEAFVDVAGVRLHYLHAGTGTPMFLIHGLVGSCADWHNNIDALAQNASVYAIDLLNMGKSQLVEGLDVSLRATANRVVAAMDSLGLAKADIVGHSYGGAIALMLAALHPRRVRRLILFAPANPYSRSSDLIVRIYSTACGRFIARMLPYFPASLQRIALGQRRYSGPKRIVDSCMQQIVDGLRCPGTLRHVLSIVHCWFAEMSRLEAVLRRVARIPTLLVWGDRDCTVSLASGIRLNHKLRASELIVLPGAHSVFKESPEESNRVMLEWLGRHPLPAPLSTTVPVTSALRPREQVHRVSIAAKAVTAPGMQHLSPRTCAAPHRS
jgi:pimeloyl-ACP methyl ester carboxylesterase